MGWINYVIIEAWNIAIEVPRAVTELEDHEKEAMKKALEFECNTQAIKEKNYKDLTLTDLSNMTESLSIAGNFFDMHLEKFLLFFLEDKGIQYEIKSEFDFDAKNSKLLIVRM